jgi:hypothetical protein
MSSSRRLREPRSANTRWCTVSGSSRARRRDDIVEDDYNEALVELPFVTFRHQDGSVSGPYFQMTALRVDSELAYKLGVALGFPKQLAIMDVTDTTYSIRMQEDENSARDHVPGGSRLHGRR